MAEGLSDLGFRLEQLRGKAFRATRALSNPNSDPEYAFALLKKIASYLTPDYRLSSPFVDWFKDRELADHMIRFGDSAEKAHRLMLVSQLLKIVSDIPGDTAEIGTYRGSSSSLICRANSRSPVAKTHFVFDSFEGLSMPGSRDGEYWKRGDLTSSYEDLYLTTELDGDFRVMSGWVPDRFYEVKDRRFSFVHIDVDLKDPTRQSLDFFSARMASGGIILNDDYGSTRCPGVTEAVDEFAETTGVKWVALPAGGAFAIL